MGQVAALITGVQRTRRLKQHDVTRRCLGHGSVRHAARNDDKFSGTDRLRPVAKLHPQAAVDDQKQLVFVLMLVPDKLTLPA